MKRIPAALRFEVIDSIGPAKVSAAELGPIWVTMSVIWRVVVCGIAEQAEHRDERDQRREQRQQPVVGERRRPVGHVVLLELERGPLQRRPQAGARHRCPPGRSRRAPARRPRGPRGAPAPPRCAPRRRRRSLRPARAPDPLWSPSSPPLDYLLSGFSSPGHDPVARTNATRVPRSTSAAHEPEDRPLDQHRDDQTRPGDLALVGLGRLLVGEPTPDELEQLRGDQPGEQAADQAERGEEDLPIVARA